ncbi:hypothetical protein MJD09_04835 [bacterium]|nr:hypothetical protein [bacterium]
MQIDRLIVFAGPSCSGKSTVMERLQGGSLRSLSEKLELDDPCLWLFAAPKDLSQSSEAFIPRLILHYDMVGSWKSDDFQSSYEDDKRLRILDISNETRFVTFWTSPATLGERIETREEKRARKYGKKAHHRQGLRPEGRLRKLRLLYTDQDRLRNQYEMWFRFCHFHNAKMHWIMDTTQDTPILYSIEEWRHYAAEENQGRESLNK